MKTAIALPFTAALAFASLALTSTGAYPQTNSPASRQPSPPATQQDRPAAGTDDRQSNLARGDRSFLENAIQGSYAEIEGSRLALERTKSDDVRKFARMMIEDHGRMVEETARLATEKGMTPPRGPSAMQTVEITALKALKGDAFDAMYVNRVGVASHEATVEMFEKAGQETRDPDVKALATQVLPKLREHLEMARSVNRKQENR